MTEVNNPLKLCGIEFTEYATPDSDFMEKAFYGFGFSKTKKFKGRDIDYFNQNDIHFLLNNEQSGFSREFAKSHGPAICSMGWRVEDAQFAFDQAIERGAKSAQDAANKLPYPAIYGIGDSLIYFIDKFGAKGSIYEDDFEAHPEAVENESKGFQAVDHLTNNVYQGTMEKWANFYKDVFGFTEVRYFDIKGEKTALVSYALQSPCGKFSIPINEGKGTNNNQIDEYLEEYNGPGVQHLAFITDDLVGSLDKLDKSIIDTLNIVPEYYDDVFDRIPWVKEDKEKIRDHQILVDSQKENSYLLQIFTKNIFGPIFIEMIQRVDDKGFGEGNFTALFKSIELNQMERGVL
ncbi:4-hydroxyphenylpyruvate dioxygenase [Thalassotalea agarivorans]|uniref:4-hydroxyphenylpyruvate dioxygenase n=1 Tax=Thalassotalea agarivorans TaxID=349064 RepID=A0A1I0FB09_THASX|nr:4-hydroxyphenylpyruvate dioxygenase [Thalassotalea agarivorans]SET55126.1 4-hydroxyphenylpyruvate dioxygenase [Thalassotalea agarivorans]